MVGWLIKGARLILVMGLMGRASQRRAECAWYRSGLASAPSGHPPAFAVIERSGHAVRIGPDRGGLKRGEPACGDIGRDVVAVLPLPVVVVDDDVDAVVQRVDAAGAATVGRLQIDIPVVEAHVAEEAPDGVGVAWCAAARRWCRSSGPCPTRGAGRTDGPGT